MSFYYGGKQMHTMMTQVCEKHKSRSKNLVLLLHSSFFLSFSDDKPTPRRADPEQGRAGASHLRAQTGMGTSGESDPGSSHTRQERRRETRQVPNFRSP